LSIESLTSRFVTGVRGTRIALVALVGALILSGTACGGETAGNASGDSERQQDSGSEQSSEKAEKSAAGTASGSGGAEETTMMGNTPEETTTRETTRREPTEKAVDGEAAELTRAEVGRREITNMLPAGGERPDPARPLPENPPNGIEVYPATTNRTVEGPIDYDRRPPTNGNHDPLWQNCGFYERPIKDRHAVHSMDHGVVWITYRPDLPAGQIEALRPYGRMRYVIVSPYPGQDAPVIATSWRVQLKLEGADDPRLRRFVEGFRISELSPLSGNRCALGVGNPRG
jgi:hypothetical protein